MAHTSLSYLAYKANRLSGKAPVDSSTSRSLRSNYERILRQELSESEYQKLMTPAMIRSHNARKPFETVAHDDPIPQVHDQSLGFLAEDYIFYQLHAHGYEVYRPFHPIPGTDMIVTLDDHTYRRIEVKATSSIMRKCVSIGRTNRQGERIAYSDGISDFYIAVELISKVVLVVPAAAVGPKQSVRFTPSSPFWKYKDRYDLIGVSRQMILEMAPSKKLGK